MAAIGRKAALHEDYDGFVEKFKPKRTTDGCYTPPEIYDVVADYVTGRWGVDRADMVNRWSLSDCERAVCAKLGSAVGATDSDILADQ